jgi:thioredoxin-like negative regulator of GroEL
MLSKSLEEIQTDVIIENIDIDEKMEIAKEYNIRGVPTMIMLEENVEVKRKSGMMMKPELEAWLNG